MSSHKPLFSLLLVAALAGGIWIVLSGNGPDALPRDLDRVDPSSAFLNAEASISYYREAIHRNPDAVEERARLAHVLLQQARSTGREAEFIPEARQLLEDALALDPEHFYGLTLQASLFNTLHRFEDARDVSERLLERYPRHAFAMGTLVDTLVELGEYEQAVETADAMLALRPGLPSYSRASYLRELNGDTDGALAAMTMAADAEPTGRESRAWALYQLGNLYLSDAKSDTAAFIFEGILEERPDFVPALTGLGHVALVKGEVDLAIARLEEARALSPREAIDQLLAEAYTLTGDTNKARDAANRVLESLKDAREMGEIVEMEEADFLADLGRELPRALELARGQLERRPGHLHANETFAWALYKSGMAEEAVFYIEQAMRLNTGDAMVHYRAARIYEAAGRPADAAEHLQLALDAHLRIESPSAAQDAEALLAGLDQRGGAPVQVASTSR